jgi:hypothetical protein
MLVSAHCAHGKGFCVYGESACYYSPHAYRRRHGRQSIARLSRAYKWAERIARKSAKKCEASHVA